MFSRLGEAVKDAAETLRRAFQDTPSRSVALALSARSRRPLDPLSAVARPGLDPPAARLGRPCLLPAPRSRQAEMHFESRLCAEGAWASWASGAKVAEVPVFRAERCARLEVPALPKAPKVLGLAAAAFGTKVRRGFEGVKAPAARAQQMGFGEPGARGGLELALRLPIAVEGLDLREAPRAIQMRYVMLAVKATGENVRNLELLGRYLIPRKGVRELRHDPRTGRLLVLLGPEATNARKEPLLLARRKDDHSLLTTFLEEG